MSGSNDVVKGVVAIVREHDDLQNTLYEPIAEPPIGGWRCECQVCVAAARQLATLGYDVKTLGRGGDGRLLPTSPGDATSFGG